MAAPKGICCLCGTEGPLSFEHVPPQSAFNDRPVFKRKMEDWLGAENPFEGRGRQQQRGNGAYTLCGRCNNLTGHWYGTAFGGWAYQAMDLLLASGGKTSLLYPFNIYPLRVLKEILCMFFSTCGPSFRTKHPELVRFVLDRERVGIPARYRIFIYLNSTTLGRKPLIKSSGVVALGKVRPGPGISFSSLSIFSEVAFPPAGYVLLFEGPAPDRRLHDISYFARYRYNDWRQVFLQPSALPLSTPFPADFRTREEVEEQAAQSELEERARRLREGRERRG